MIKSQDNTYELLDSGHGRKLERFGTIISDRPCAQAVWQPRLSKEIWEQADVRYLREGRNEWSEPHKNSQTWLINISGIKMKLMPTDFGHFGAFPEHAFAWKKMTEIINSVPEEQRSEINILNLFAYTGGATLAAARCGVRVCHLDASKKSVQWARENSLHNNLENAPVRWIVDDVKKFLQREIRRGMTYDGILLDPPSFGRGAKQEVFKIEDDLHDILLMCKKLLGPKALFIFLSCHTPGYTPLVMHHLLSELSLPKNGTVKSGEMTLTGGSKVLPLPSGTYAFYSR